MKNYKYNSFDEEIELDKVSKWVIAVTLAIVVSVVLFAPNACNDENPLEKSARQFVAVEFRDTNVVFTRSVKGDFVHFVSQGYYSFSLLMMHGGATSKHAIQNACKCPNTVYKPKGAPYLICNEQKYYIDTLWYAFWVEQKYGK